MNGYDIASDTTDDPVEMEPESTEEKRRRRMKRNRESAALSRDRKKQLLERTGEENASLKEKVTNSEAENASLRAKLRESESQVEALKSEIRRLAPFSDAMTSSLFSECCLNMRVESLSASPMFESASHLNTVTDMSDFLLDACDSDSALAQETVSTSLP